MKSAGNEGVVQRRLQVLHVHIFFAAPLRVRYMAKPGADQHQSRVAVRERSHHAGSAADLTVQPLDHVVGTDARPMLARKIAVDQSFLNAVQQPPSASWRAVRGNDCFSLVAGRLFALLCVDCLEHSCHNFDLGFRHNRENIAIEMHCAALVFGAQEHLAHGLHHLHALVADDETYGYRPPCKGRFRQSSM